MEFNELGYLPAGIFPMAWNQFVSEFGWNQRRQELLSGLAGALRALAAAGCRAVYLDGSFVTKKAYPNDFDGCWDPVGVDDDALDPVLLDFSGHCSAQKAKYLGELFIMDWPADVEGEEFIEFFQFDRDKNPKGLILLDPREVPND